MIHLQGQLINTFKATNREGEEKDKVQILGSIAQQNGESRYDLMTVTVQDAGKYSEKKGQQVTVPVGVFAPQKGTVIFFEAR
jgi:hypothetical protein